MKIRKLIKNETLANNISSLRELVLALEPQDDTQKE